MFIFVQKTPHFLVYGGARRISNTVGLFEFDMSTEAPPSGHSPTTGKGHDVEIGLSRTVLTQIFGNEFVSTLLDSYQDVGGVQTPNSDEILHPSPAKSHLVSNDGPSKPKTPRTSAKDPTTLEDLKTLG